MCRYQATIAARNSHGWGPTSLPITFKTSHFSGDHHYHCHTFDDQLDNEIMITMMITRITRITLIMMLARITMTTVAPTGVYSGQ